MEFENLLVRAKEGDNCAKEELYLMFRPGIINKAIVDDVFDEDLFQELCIKFLSCIDKFDLEKFQCSRNDKGIK